MVAQHTAFMHRGGALVRCLILVFVGLFAGTAPAMAGKGEIRCANRAGYAELKLLAKNSSPMAFADALAQRLLAEDCYIEFVDVPRPVRTSKIRKRPTTRTRRSAKVDEATWDLADLVDHAASAIDKLLDAITTANDHCPKTECGDDFAGTGYPAE
ncbi:MAG: hypothetical protein ACR2PO_10455 [Methyloligellaceae bacterium]